MSMYFQMLDSLLAAERHRLPAEYAHKQQSVLCQDCGRAGRAPYHWVYHACPHCKSYNTRVL
jgi:zinc finger-like protein